MNQTDVTQTILVQLKNNVIPAKKGLKSVNGNVAMMCWGVNNLKAEKDALSFKVKGYSFKGTVKVKLDAGADLYDIHFYNNRLREVKTIKGVFADMMTEIIDDFVELGE